MVGSCLKLASPPRDGISAASACCSSADAPCLLPCLAGTECYNIVISGAQEAAQREALNQGKSDGDDANEMEKAQDFGRLRTVKVQQAVAKEEEEEMRVRMRQAQRKMKGVKLQYTDSDRVTFDDVAGVPGAKVELPILHPDTQDRRPPWGVRESF